MSWRELVSQGIQTDLARRAANPAVNAFSTIVQAAMNLGAKQKEEAREEARTGRTTAKAAVYGRYPQLAAQEAGIDISGISAQGTIPQGPPGMQLSKVQYDEQGNPTTVYEAPTTNEPTPSWAQEQKIQALSTGLRMGKVVIGKEFGEPSVYEVKGMEEALKAIQESGLSPALFSEELKLYDVLERRIDRKSKRAMVMLRDGRVIWEDSKELIK